MNGFISTGNAAAIELRRVISKMSGYPTPGAHAGGGRHVANPPSWDGTGKCPEGWTQHQNAVLANADAVTFAAVVDATAIADSANPVKLANISVAEQSTLTAGIAAAVLLLTVVWSTATPLAAAIVAIAETVEVGNA